MATKSTFNIPISTNGSATWVNVQFQTRQEDVEGLSEKLSEYVDFTDTNIFTQPTTETPDRKLQLTIFPDEILGQLPRLGSIIPIYKKDPGGDFYICEINELSSLGTILIKKHFPLLESYENLYLTQGSPEDGVGDSFTEATTSSLYIGYKDLPAGYFTVYADINEHPSGQFTNGFLGLDWYVDDWCVPTTIGFSHITNKDSVTSVNGQTNGAICTYGGSVSGKTTFYAGTFYLFDNNSWYPQYPGTTTANEILSPGSFLAICIKTTSSITWDSVKAETGTLHTLTKGNVETFFISSAAKDYNTTRQFKLPYTDISGATTSNVIDTILVDFGNWFTQLESGYYANSPLASGYTKDNYLYSSIDTIKITKPGGLAKGIAVMPNYSGQNWSPIPGLEDTIPTAKTGSASTINDYKFYIEFLEDPTLIQ